MTCAAAVAPADASPVRLPGQLPAGAAFLRVRIQDWSETFTTVLIPLGCAVVDPVAAYVTAVYSSLFHRVPDAGGLAAWTSALRNGTPSTAVADAITSSDEFRTRLITQVYRTYLGRAPDAGGIAYWLGRMRAGLQIEEMEAGFLSSDESYQLAGGTNDLWVASIYRKVFGRSDPAGGAAWGLQMATGVTRYQVAIGFTKSTERLSTVVDGYYVTFLGRHGEPSGVAGWVRGIQLGVRDEQIASGILVSQEYRNRGPVG